VGGTRGLKKKGEERSLYTTGKERDSEPDNYDSILKKKATINNASTPHTF